MWSEEEMRDIQPERPASISVRGFVAGVRREVSQRNVTRATAFPHDVTRGDAPSVIYAPGAANHGNFIDASYRRICTHAAWKQRLQKAHTGKRQGRQSEVREDGWRELDCANSSDALLMNIFCYPRVLASAALPAVLGVDRGVKPVFGYKPRIQMHGGLRDTTEIDMKLGALLVEAKLTESDFQIAPIRKLERYLDLDKVFERNLLVSNQGTVRSYQLIRGVLAAHALDTAFCVLCDARRPDLMEAWFEVMHAVRSCELRSRLRLHTWQELSRTLPGPLRRFLLEKYGIETP